MPKLDKNSRLRIVVRGYIVRGPLAGMAWHHLQYVMGLDLLGHDVYFVEDSGDSAWSCYDPVRQVTDTDPSYGLQFARDAFEAVGLNDRWAYYDSHQSSWLGPGAERIMDICLTADLLLNLFPEEPLLACLLDIPARALIDTDPVFTQIRFLVDNEARKLACQHTTFFSFGENIGRTGSTVPDDGFPWKPTRQPVVLNAWPVTPGPAQGKFTTIMQWESYPAQEYGGVRYGMKSDSFRPYFDLPATAGRIFELALGTASAPRTELSAAGWSLRDPLGPSRSLGEYQQYIQQSKGEFTVAKHGYTVSRCGWFSERSASYLASARPVIVQDTGFSDWLPASAGVVRFNTPEEALAGIREVNSRYDFHCRAARAIAEEYFDARKVLRSLVEQATDGAQT